MLAKEMKKEKQFLDSLVVDYTDQSPYSKAKKDVVHSLMSLYTSEESTKNVLQLGCSNGYETLYLAKTYKTVDVVDGSEKFLEKMRSKTNDVRNIHFINSLFEDFDSKGKEYDYVICNYVLEHVLDVREVLINIKKTLKNSGLIFATVPNGLAFSRQLAKKMGLINDLYGLTENDRKHGHRRVYNKELIVSDFQKAGFEVAEAKGVIFKILADFQLNKLLDQGILSEEHIDGLQMMAEGNEEFSDSIFIAARPKA